MSERVEIASVDTTGGNATLTTPLHWTFKSASPSPRTNAKLRS